MDWIEEFTQTGCVVVDNVLTQEEVHLFRQKLHETIYQNTGISHQEYLQTPSLAMGQRLKGPSANIFACKWKMDLHLHPKVVEIYDNLLRGTYYLNQGIFTHPYEQIQHSPLSLGYVDKICYRLPGEGGLSLHLDKNPLDPYLEKAGGLDKWRPIQAFVCLTDHYGSDYGGLKVVPKFHLDFDQYFNNNSKAKECIGLAGEFFRMGDKSFCALEKKLETVICSAGSMVLWDSRLPHATCDNLTTGDSREVIYTGFLPNIDLNRRFCISQWNKIHSSPDYDWDSEDQYISRLLQLSKQMSQKGGN